MRKTFLTFVLTLLAGVLFAQQPARIAVAEGTLEGINESGIKTYLIRGNCDKFKFYPFVKKRGKVTGAVVNCIYEYDAKLRPILFTDNTTENVKIINGETKLQTIIAFSAMLLRMTVNEILDLENLCHISQTETVKEAGLFDVLKMISKIQL